MKVVITSGPTVEKIDPVRYISNFSSGKMGQALATVFSRENDVTVVSGPVNLDYGVRTLSVESADEMLLVTSAEAVDADVIICAAAVCDYKPVYHDSKLKKGTDDLATIHLVENPDILREISRMGRFTVGFAAETDNVLENARKKLEKKGCNAIVANEVGHGKVFGEDTTSITIVTNSSAESYENISKLEAAEKILEFIKQNVG